MILRVKFNFGEIAFMIPPFYGVSPILILIVISNLITFTKFQYFVSVLPAKCMDKKLFQLEF